VQLVVDGLGTVYEKNVTVLGAAFKPPSDDIRDSPALDVAVRLHGIGPHITVIDPAAIENARRLHPQLTYVEDHHAAIHDADSLVLVTEWDECRRQLPPEHASSLTPGRVIVDGCNGLDAAAWWAGGWAYYGMGRLAFRFPHLYTGRLTPLLTSKMVALVASSRYTTLPS
jgi:UDPglucose 6-dehydrogenase